MKTIFAREPSQTATEALVGGHQACVWLGVGFVRMRQQAPYIMLLVGVFLFGPFAMIGLAGHWIALVFGVLALAFLAAPWLLLFWLTAKGETPTFGLLRVGERVVIMIERSPTRVRHMVVNAGDFKLSTHRCLLDPGPLSGYRESYIVVATADHGRTVTPLALRATEQECALWHTASAFWSAFPLTTSRRTGRVYVRDNWKAGAYPRSIQESVVCQALLGRDRDLRRVLSVCGRCGYDLRGLPAAARCPECGK